MKDDTLDSPSLLRVALVEAVWPLSRFPPPACQRLTPAFLLASLHVLSRYPRRLLVPFAQDPIRPQGPPPRVGFTQSELRQEVDQPSRPSTSWGLAPPPHVTLSTLPIALKGRRQRSPAPRSLIGCYLHGFLGDRNAVAWRGSSGAPAH